MTITIFPLPQKHSRRKERGVETMVFPFALLKPASAQIARVSVRIIYAKIMNIIGISNRKQ